MIKNSTLDFYEENADNFVQGTIDAVLGEVQTHFASRLPKGSYLLDFGCGSGRDTKAFLQMGYRVDAIDGSKRLCEIASEYTGVQVKCMLFSELEETEKYDGIWACSSILYLPENELTEVIGKMTCATKKGGFIYTSFKYGDFQGYRKERYFTDFTEERFAAFINNFRELSIIEMWVSHDVRPDRGKEKWLNIILKRSDTI